MNNFNSYPYGPNYMGPTYGANNPYANNTKSQQTQMRQYDFVNGIQGAKDYPLSPGQTMMLMDQQAMLCYMKSADDMGRYNLSYYKLEEVDESTAKDIVNPPSPQPNYALKEDIDILNKKFDDLLKALNNKPKKDQSNL